MNPESLFPPKVSEMTKAEKTELEARYWVDPAFNSELAPHAGSALPTSPVEIYLISTDKVKEAN